VTTCFEISFFLKTTAKKLGSGQYIVGHQPKSWGPVSPGPCGCCAYAFGSMATEQNGRKKLPRHEEVLLSNVVKHGRVGHWLHVQSRSLDHWRQWQWSVNRHLVSFMFA